SVCDAVVHLRVSARIGKTYHGLDRLALQVQRPANAARLRRTSKSTRADNAFRVNRTEPGMRAGKCAHSLDELSNNGWRGGGHFATPSPWRTWHWLALREN